MHNSTSSELLDAGLDPLPRTCLPDWGRADLPEPQRLGWRNWPSFLGPGIVMMGIQIGGGEWLFGPEITARYGGGLMWIATVAIVLQVFYNLECGRYALYCGEPIMTGFLRTRPGPHFWISLILLLNLGALIPGLSTHGAALLAALYLDRPPTADDRWLVTALAYACLLAVALPILIGGKVYTMLQVVMTAKVVVVLSFCLAVGLLFVSPAHWWDVFSGFVKFGQVPVADGRGGETVTNAFLHYWREGDWPLIALGNIAVLGAFAGYAGGGGLANSTYSNFVRDKGWGMGASVGAIASAVGGRRITLHHVGKVFPLSEANLQRWNGWWKYLLLDQVLVWAPGCFMGMALPALLSLQFAHDSELYHQTQKLEWAQAVITADGIRHAPQFGPELAKILWLVTLGVGLMVMLPSQMSIVDDFSRRWTDILWSGSRRVRERMLDHQVKYIYYTILGSYVLWTFVCAWLFSTYGTPKLMVVVIANLNNLAIGLTAFHLLWVNRTLLPAPLRPRWYQQLGVAACGTFYLGLAALVFLTKQWPVLREFFAHLGSR
jgi:hypothetical protein